MAGLSLGDAGYSRSDGESTTTVTSVVTGAGATAGEAMTKAGADRASEAALDEARDRMGAWAGGSQVDASDHTEVDEPRSGSDEHPV